MKLIELTIKQLHNHLCSLQAEKSRCETIEKYCPSWITTDIEETKMLIEHWKSKL